MARQKYIGQQKAARSQTPPVGFASVGSCFAVGDRLFEVVKRPDCLKPCNACFGCSFSNSYCPNMACSGFDRSDGISVWFVEV